MCSIEDAEDAAIAAVISAIDELAAESGSELTPADLRARVAGIWAMLTAIDPEVARLTAAYDRLDGD